MIRSRGRTLRRVVPLVLVVALVVAGLAFGVWRWRARGGEQRQASAGELWTCPMHPSVIRDEPGECPICGMDLVPLEKEERKPGGIEGHGVVEISPEKQQLIGVATATVGRRQLRAEVRTVGSVTVSERLLSDIHTKVEGWVEKLYAEETGAIVRKGEPLLTIYSPELVSTQEEYLLALRSRERVKDSPFPEVRRSGDSMAEAARKRLRLWDIPEEEIERLERTGEVREALTLYSPSTGYVLDKHVVEGMRVTPAMVLFRVADLSQVWVGADVYEQEASLVKEGMEATFTTVAHPGREFSGRVTYLYPTLDTATRTLKARLEFPNPGLTLKPGMYGDITIAAPSGDVLAIPEEAVLDSGTRQIVFVKEGEGRFVPREVKLGVRVAGFRSVLSGLTEGEQVVASPNFLIDSESRFQAAIEAKTGGDQDVHTH